MKQEYIQQKQGRYEYARDNEELQKLLSEGYQRTGHSRGELLPGRRGTNLPSKYREGEGMSSTYERIHTTNPRMNYYLLDWRDSHLEEFTAMFGDKRMKELTPEEYTALFNHVVQNDLKYLTA